MEKFHKQIRQPSKRPSCKRNGLSPRYNYSNSENPFHKPSMENTQNENTYMNKETINEIIKISTQQFREANESRDRKESDLIDDRSINRSILNEETMHDAERSDFYDNKYWKQEVPEIDFEIS